MIDPVTLLAFVPAALALNLTPGADMMFCLGRGLRDGARAATAASAGIALGGMAHATLAGTGLAAAMDRLPWLFDVIRWVGVAYLLWLAFQALGRPAALSSTARTAPGDAGQRGLTRAFLTGLVVNLTNPKVALFVLAFVPQFVDPAHPVLAQFLVFGLILSLGGFVINALVGAGAGGLGDRLARSGRARRWLGRISGGVFALLALRLAVLERS